MKTTKSVLFALLFSVILPAFAHAVPAPFFSPYAEIYTVASYGSTTPDSSFTGSQVPYLYIELYNTPPVNLTGDLTLTVWKDSSTFNIYPNGAASTGNQIWISFPQNYWDTISATPGTWSIKADTTAFSDFRLIGNLYGTTSFTDSASNYHVNSAPEPMGTVLYLIGGTIMAVYVLRRKKALAV